MTVVQATAKEPYELNRRMEAEERPEKTRGIMPGGSSRAAEHCQ